MMRNELLSLELMVYFLWKGFSENHSTSSSSSKVMPIVQGHWVISKLSDDMGLILLLAKGK